MTQVGIATSYWPDGPGIDSRWWRDFPHPPRPALGPTQRPIQWIPGHAGGIAAGRDVNHPPLLALRLKKEWSYTYNSCGPSWPILE